MIYNKGELALMNYDAIKLKKYSTLSNWESFT